MRRCWFTTGLAAGTLLLTLHWSNAFAMDPQAENSSPQPPTRTDSPAEPTVSSAPSTAAAPAPSPAVADVLKLLQAGVSQEAVRSFIAQAPISSPLSATDVLTLKQRSVPDNLILALVQRSAQLRSPAEATPRQQALPNRPIALPSYPEANGQPSTRPLDPESYEFWWYHYAYPRALAYANQRLLSSYRPPLQLPTGDYSGYYPLLPFGPESAGRFFPGYAGGLRRAPLP